VQALRERLPQALRDQLELLEEYQLQIENALDLVGRDHVLFIDASLNCAAPFEVRQLQPQRDPSYTSHSLSPEALLQVFSDSQGCAPPPASLLAIQGQTFELGQPLSAAAQVHLEAAVAWALDWLKGQ
jgi:hydrogenase maturation protease